MTNRLATLAAFAISLSSVGCASAPIVGRDLQPTPNAKNVQGIRSALARAHGKPLRILLVHGMLTAKPEYSANWQKQIGEKLGLARAEMATVPIVRQDSIAIGRGSDFLRGDQIKPSTLEISHWRDSSGDRLIFYELTWAPLRDEVKYWFLGCFEARSLPKDTECPTGYKALPNNERRGELNAELKDKLMIGGLADASIVLGPVGNVLHDDVDQAICIVARETIEKPVARGRRCDLDELVAEGTEKVDPLATAPFIAITHSLGSFLLLEAEDSARVAQQGIHPVQTKTSRAYQLLDSATVYMFANQVALLGLGRLSVTCPTKVLVDCSGSKREVVQQGIRSLASNTTYVAFNDPSDVLGYELPPYLPTTGRFGRMVNVSVQNPDGVGSIAKLFKNPASVHTRHSDNEAIIDAIVDSLRVEPAAVVQSGKVGFHGLSGIHFGGPIGPSASFTISHSVSCLPIENCERREGGLFGTVEPGQRGLRGSAGWGQFAGNLGYFSTVRLTAMRSCEWWVKCSGSRTDYAGAELSFAPAVFLGARVGSLWALDGPRRGHPLVLLDFALGL